MNATFRFRYALIPLSLATILGCLNFYDRPSGSSGGSTDLVSSPSDDPRDGATDGLFPPGSHDVEDQTLVGSGATDVEEGAETESFFRAIQIDPLSEDSAGPKFVVAGDIDNDGLLDLASGWNQSQPVQIHLQRRSEDEDGDEVIAFRAVTIAGTTPVATMAGVELADMDRDGWLDIIVLVKDNGFAAFCIDLTGEFEPEELDAESGEIIIYYNPGNLADIDDGDEWLEVELGRSFIEGRRDNTAEEARVRPELNGYSSLQVGEVDGINGPDIVVALNPAECRFSGEDPPLNRIELFANPGNDFARDPANPPLTVTADAGPDQNIGVPDDPSGAPELVVLDGTASFASDANGLWYQWEQIFGPTISLDLATTANPEFFGPTTPSTVQFRMTVFAFSDPTVSDFDIVTIFFGDASAFPPFSYAGPDQVVIPLRPEPGSNGFENPENVLLDGSSSTDVITAPGQVLPITYQWTQTHGPAVALIGDTTSNAIFTAPDEPATLRFRLTVTDDDGLQATDLVEVLVRQWAPVMIVGDLPIVRDCLLLDVEDDGDLDIVYTYPNSVSANVSWSRNPRSSVDDAEELPGRDLVLDGAAAWEGRPVGHVDTDADVLSLGDVDGDGFEDILVRSTIGAVVQWFRRPTADDSQPIFPPPDPVPTRFDFPWQVYSLFEFNATEPVAIGLGDLTGDGLAEAVIGAGSGVSWYAPPIVTTEDGDQEIRPLDLWTANIIIRDTSGSGGQDGTAVVNEVLVIDLDADGKVDFLGGVDRQVESGLSDDSLIWYRNVIGEDQD